MSLRSIGRWVLVLAGLYVISGCAHTEVTVLFGPRSIEGETDLGAFLMVAQPFGKRGICVPYMHSSNPGRGVPFNDRPEYVLDAAAMCGVRWGGK